MTRTMKDRWITISLAVVCSFGSVFVGNWLVGRTAKAGYVESRFKKLEDEKLDKSEFVNRLKDHTEQQNKEFMSMQKYMDAQFDDLKEFIRMINNKK